MRFSFCSVTLPSKYFVNQAKLFYTGSSQQISEVESYLNTLQTDSNAIDLLVSVVKLNYDKYSNMIAVIMIKKLLADCNLVQDQITQLRILLYKIVKFPRGRDPAVRNEAINILADIAIRTWPDNWPTFIGDILEFDSLHPVLTEVAFRLHNDLKIPSKIRNHLQILMLQNITSTDAAKSIDIAPLFEWIPLQYINDTVIAAITEKSPALGSKCLYSLFIERDDTDDLLLQYASKIFADLTKSICPIVLRFFASLFQKYLIILFPQYVADIAKILPHLSRQGWCQKDAYIDYWESILTFFMPRKKPIVDDNPVSAHLPFLFGQIASIIEPDPGEDIISDSVRNILTIFAHEIPCTVEFEIVEQQLSKNLLLVIAGVVKRIKRTTFLAAIDRVIVLCKQTRDMEIVEISLQTLASACYYFDIRDDILVTFVLTMNTFIRTTNPALHEAVVKSLNFISANCPSAFLLKDGILIENIIQFLSGFQPQQWKDPRTHSMFLFISRVLLQIESNEKRKVAVERVFGLAFDIVMNGTQDLPCALSLLADACFESTAIGQVYQQDLLTRLVDFVADETVGEDAITLALELLCEAKQWDDICDDFETIFQSAMNTSHPENMVTFMIKLQIRFPEVLLNFDQAFLTFCTPLLQEVTENTAKVFVYMKKNMVWAFDDYPLPIDVIHQALVEYPLVSMSGVRLIDAYLMKSSPERLANIITQQGNDILATLTMCIIDTSYNYALDKCIVTFYDFAVSFAHVARFVDLPRTVFYNQFKGVVTEYAPLLPLNPIITFLDALFYELGSVKSSIQLIRDFIISAQHGFYNT